MSTIQGLRGLATQSALAAFPTKEVSASPAPSSYFGEYALTWTQLEKRLDAATGAALREYVTAGKKPNKDQANKIADGVKAWGLEHGATHYAHWFQPLTGLPADKQDSFLTPPLPGQDVAAIDELRGVLLLQGEPDASSFPSGGLRVTHEARGYTVWDPATPLFLRDDGNIRSVCIPCAFIGWKGHAFDSKTPLLRALDALSRETCKFLNLLGGGTEVKKVSGTLGPEQEYFLIDKSFLATRPDLVMAGRSLVGAPPARGQQLEDHYFGPIPARVQAFMTEFERESYRLGIPLKTRHCEVAPAQFEVAPVFEDVSVACDHNVLMMDVMKRVAERHGFACLLHEKPFAGINGNGKHNNWSLQTDAGENLLEPGDKPESNLRFLTTLAAIFTTVHRHADAMRVSIASAGNDHRLGANEAPPPIISIFLGDALDQLCTAIEKGLPIPETALGDLRVTANITAKRDSTDRNRTAPFAFTGNKFEFRAVGSDMNCAWPMAILNAGVAEAFRDLSKRLEEKLKGGADRSTAALSLIREVFAETKAVRFEGNNYSAEWLEEAKKRGLPVLSNTPQALAVLTNEKSTAFLVDLGVFTQEEIHSRYEIYAERYLKIIDIEAITVADIAATYIAPAIESEIASAGSALKALADAGAPKGAVTQRIGALAQLLEALHAGISRVEAARDVGHGPAALKHVADTLIPANLALRATIDAAEGIVSDSRWPLPKYREMLFLGV